MIGAAEHYSDLERLKSRGKSSDLKSGGESLRVSPDGIFLTDDEVRWLLQCASQVLGWFGSEDMDARDRGE